MPIVRIDVMEGRPLETLQRLIVQVTETVAQVLDTPADRVRVIVNEVPPDLWGIGGVPATEAGRAPGVEER
jgi:4-oxalocrotonate tautomerase